MCLHNNYVYILNICQCIYLNKSILYHPSTLFVYVSACLSSVSRARIIYDIVCDIVYFLSESSDGKNRSVAVCC